MRGRVHIVGLLVLVHCGPRPKTWAEEALAHTITTADEAWSRRGETGLAPALEAVLARPSVVADHPEVLWREARVRVAMGWVDDAPVDQRRAFAAARAVAMGCLLAVPSVKRRARAGQLQGGLAMLPLERTPCAAWAGIAWTRWVTTWEPGAVDLDLPAARALLRAGGASHAGLTRWSRLTLRAWEGALLEQATEELVAAGRGADVPPWVWWEDVSRWVYPVPVQRRPSASPATPEDRAAHRRLTAPNDENEGN